MILNNNNNNNMANAISGKTARACDCCVRKRARWYCAADDAFLCQACDGSVHSANPLARRHERLRLNSASLKQSHNLPTWHRGLTKKARTPRHGKPSLKPSRNPADAVPDIGIEETTSFSSSHGEDEEQLLFRVPIYDPFVGELCTSTSTPTDDHVTDMKNDHQLMIKSPQDGYLPSDLELEEFAADVETLLGKGLDDESYGIEELGLLNYNNGEINFEKVVKEENGGELINNCEIEVESNDVGIRVPFELTFDYDAHDFPTSCEGHHQVMMVESSSIVEGIRFDQELCKVEGDNDEKENNNEVMVMNDRKKILLSLDYDAISVAWASHGSPWINGQRPDISPEDCWPHSMETDVHNHALFGDTQIGGMGENGGIVDVGREARVSRYREKRRTRLFSKKIRYEVRKLNAEKRPRMKGRFVKRSSFVPTTTPFPLISKK